ncbi:hypothetical protein LCGC14_1518680 [marine sediment metagenome]|uniref:ParB-like N-terminal domain-containing protein n=1 Tax=marine sediment metagenome TaxID=412755 RepID=A0A0F9IZA2_9ZZZZ
MQTKLLPVKKLRLDGDTQPRVEIDEDVVAEYAAAYKASAKMPPVVVFFDGTDHWLADGFHRRFAAIKAKSSKIRCEVRKGTREDARWYSYSANQTHGLRRSNADKAKAVKAALKHPKAEDMTDVKIATHVGVSGQFVGKIRKQLEDANETPARPRPSRGSGRSNSLTQQPDSGDTESEYEKCPECGGEDFHEDGTCASCIQDADPGEEVDVKPNDPGDPATILKCNIRDVVQEWMKNVDGANRMVAACVLENCAAELREQA